MIADNQLIIAMSGQELSHQELLEIVLQQRKELEGTRKELDEFRSFVWDKVVPLEERVFALKRLSHREREVEVEAPFSEQMWEIILQQRKELSDFCSYVSDHLKDQQEVFHLIVFNMVLQLGLRPGS